MKKYFLISLILSCSLFTKAQTVYPGVPLYGTTASQDRTYRSLQLGTATITNTTVSNTPDTITFVPGSVSGLGAVFHKDYWITVADTCVFAIRDVSSSYTGSTIRLWITSANASSLIKFLGYSGLATQWSLTAAATTVLLTQNHWFTITFVCTGSKWAEISQSQD